MTESRTRTEPAPVNPSRPGDGASVGVFLNRSGSLLGSAAELAERTEDRVMRLAAIELADRAQAANPNPASTEPEPDTAANPVVRAARDRGPLLLLGLFYAVMAGLALFGQTQGIVHWLGIQPHTLPLAGWRIPARLPALGPASAIELLAAVVFAFADWRRAAKNEAAIPARMLSVLVAAGIAGLNWAGHPGDAEAGQRYLFTGASVAAYCVWVLHTNARRRDAQRAKGNARQAAPEYGAAQWAMNPLVTARARSLTLVDATLGRAGSLRLAATLRAGERQRRVLGRAIRARIAAGVDPLTADIAVASYDLDGIAARIAADVDNAGMAGLLGADLTPSRLTSLAIEPEPAAEPVNPAPAERTELAQPAATSWHVVRFEPAPATEPARQLATEPQRAAAPNRPAPRPAVNRPTEPPRIGAGDQAMAESIREFVAEFKADKGRVPGQHTTRDALKERGFAAGLPRAGAIATLADQLGPIDQEATA